MSISASTMLKILQLAVQYGIPAVTEIIQTWDSDDKITPEMVEERLAAMKPAGEAFDRNSG